MAQVKIYQCICMRCAYRWFPRSERAPVMCPKCRSAYWNIPRKAKQSEEKTTA